MKVKYTPERIIAALESSLAALQTSYIDLYQVHWPGNIESHPECVAALEQAKSEGRIRHYGVCNFGTEDLAQFKAAGGKPVTNQLPYNLLWRSIERKIAGACMEEGIGVLCYSPLQVRLR